MTGRSVQQARAKLAALGLHVETDGEGGTVTGQIPSAGTTVDGRNTVLLLHGMSGVFQHEGRMFSVAV